jgi:acetolactate synthase-1/2/3 large subunit
MKNAELIVQMLEQAGVKWAFGIPSGPVLPLIEALRQSSIQYVLTANETSAGFMAATVGALTGTPGVCVSTLGPGATNLATGVGAAWLDGAPVIAITCNVPTAWLERRIQMRIDHHALLAPITKASFALRDGFVGAPLAEALRLAREERPGPVHLDLPEDVASMTAREHVLPLPDPAQLPPVFPHVFGEVDAALSQSRRPVLIAGLALTRATEPARLIEFIERQNMPFLLTLHAKGFLPESHPNYAGVLGRARRSDVQRFVDGADLIVAAGYDEIEINYEEWAGNKPIVHLSSQKTEPSEDLRLAVNVGGNMDSIIHGLAMLPKHDNAWQRFELEGHASELEANLRPEAKFSAHHVLDLLRRRLGPDDVLAYDVGAHTHQIATQWRTDAPNTCISTNGWSSMGYGIPAAYAAKLVSPTRPVVGVVGDGCFQMTAGELALGRRLNLKVPIVVLNDGWLSLLRVKQERKEYGLSGVDLGTPPPSPAHYFGVPCRGAHDERELGQALEWALALDGPSVIEAFISTDEYTQTVYD